MPQAYEMSWEPAAFRWVKMFQGTRYRVTCQELGAMVWTREGSAKLANDWWRAKFLELRHPREQLLQEAESHLDKFAELSVREAAFETQLFAMRTKSPEVRERLMARADVTEPRTLP